MKQPTIDQILACDDEAQLNEWCAHICMGYEPPPRLHNQLVQRNCDRMIIAYVDFNPCQNKSQAFDLMVKFDVERKFQYIKFIGWVYTVRDKRGDIKAQVLQKEWDGSKLIEISEQMAIVKASLCSVVSE